MILRRNLDYIKEKDKTKHFNFQRQSARIKHWFGIDHEWNKETFMTRKLDFYKKTISN